VKKLENAVIYWVYDYGLYQKFDRKLIIFKELMESGLIDILQFRAKSISLDEYLVWCETLLKKIPESKSLLLANDFCGAVDRLGLDGVHIGQKDLPLPEARELLGSKIIGATARSMQVALEAEPYADYIGAGTVFETTTKQGLNPRGPAFIKEITTKIKKPIFPIGGISSNNASELVEKGIRKAAVASSLMNSAKPFDELVLIHNMLKGS
jgi:thiamine-phosphate pyrophosphorylase